MNNLTDADLDFCEEFVRTFNFSKACLEAKVNRVTMIERLKDEKSNINLWIRNSIDELAVANSFVDQEVVISGLVNIFLSGEEKSKLQAAKMLLENERSPDKTKEFKDLIDKLNNTRAFNRR